MRCVVIWIIGAVALAGCGGSAVATGTGSSTTGGATSGGSASAGTSGTGGRVALPPITLVFPPLSAATGEDATQCIEVNLGNAVPIHLGEIHNLLDNGAFTLAVYRSSATTPQPAPFACNPLSQFGRPDAEAPLILSQKADDDLVLPAGVGLSLAANQMVRLELHVFNGTASPISVGASTTLVPMADASFQTEAAFLLVGDTDLSLMPEASETVGGFANLTAAAPAGGSLAQVIGLTHALGTQVAAGVSTGSVATPTSIYDGSGWVWSDPPRIDPPASTRLPANGGIRLDCDYDNQTTNPVAYGQGFAQEVCFVGAYLYPGQGTFVCLHSDASGGSDVCCPGEAICSTLFP